MRNIGIQYEIKQLLLRDDDDNNEDESSPSTSNMDQIVDFCYITSDHDDEDNDDHDDDDHDTNEKYSTARTRTNTNFSATTTTTTIGILTQMGYLYYVRTSSSSSKKKNKAAGAKIVWKVNLNTSIGSESTTTTTTTTTASTTKDWFNITYIESNHTIVALHHNGSIVSIPLATTTTTQQQQVLPEPELVGEFEYGICTASWNPDGTVLVLVTSVVDDDEDDTDAETDMTNNKNRYSVLLSLNTNWDVLSEVRLDHRIDETQIVALCWNKATTATTSNSSSTPQQELIAISSVDYNDDDDNHDTTKVQQQQRKIRIYNGMTLELHAMGRTEDGSGKLIPNIQATSNISWASNGCSNLLTIVETKGSYKTYVAFIEPNGLRHREFLLQRSNTTTTKNQNTIIVTSLQWNMKSDLLAVTLQERNNDSAADAAKTKLQLWHRSNYHWYMKYEWIYNQADAPLIVQFHPTNSYLLYIGFKDLRWNMIHVRWDVCTRPCTKSLEDITTAYSIDGNLLNITNLERCCVPPPMYDYTIPFTTGVSVHEIATTKTMTTLNPQQQVQEQQQQHNYCAVVSLSDASFAILTMNDGIYRVGEAISHKQSFYPVVDRIVTLENTMQMDIYNLRQLHIIQKSQVNDNNDSSLFLLAIGTSWEQTGIDFLVEIVIDRDVANIVGVHPLDQYCMSISCWMDSSSSPLTDAKFLVQLQDGTLLDYTCTLEGNSSFHGDLSRCTVENLLEPCPWIQCCRCPHNVSETYDDSRLVIGMSANGRLYCNDYQIADSVSSFTISYDNEFLCFVTTGSRYVLRFIPLRDLLNFDPLLGSDENSTLLGYEPRYVERGSILVSVLTKQPAVVLQMNRGNLEMIYPRALVLRHAMKQILDMQYRDAFQLMRRQKVDLNLIVDMDPYHFVHGGGVEAFVEQVDNIDYLNLFISNLQDWDSTKERYPIPHWINASQSDAVSRSSVDFTSKVNLVCKKIREVMTAAQVTRSMKPGRSISEDYFLLPILSTYAKENPPKLEDALLMIRENANKKQNASSKKPPLFSDTAQDSIQYLAFMADYELLFKTALGLYDFDMARAVARNSQMDPKVYLPLLQNYRNLPLYFGRYQVDLNLKRYELALRNLYESMISGELVDSNDESKSGQTQKSNDFTEFQNLVETHKLHRVGLEICTDSEQRNILFQSLGSQLLADKKPETALMVFLSAESIDQEQCIRAAKESQNWSTLFSLPAVSNDLQRKERLAWEIADDLATRAEGSQNKTFQMENAARVLLDYGNDLDASVKMLIKAESWQEAQRISILHQRDDLGRDVVDAAISYAQHVISDFEDRIESFKEASSRYDEVLRIRKEALQNDGFDPATILDAGDDMSLFSSASNASNISMRSSTSVGSSTSLSSVISVKSTNSFSLIGSDDTNRHKSKYNASGGGQRSRKSKKKPKGRNKISPGSEEDLLGIVQTLKSNIVDEMLLLSVGKTIVFLIHNAHQKIARALYSSYLELSNIVNNAKKVRADSLSIHAVEGSTRPFGDTAMHRHKVEDEVDALACASLPSNVVDIFTYLPSVSD